MLITEQKWQDMDPYTKAIERVRQENGQDLAVEGRRALVPS